MNEFDLQQRLSEDAEALVRNALRAALRNPKGSAFLARFAAASARASKRRLALEREGLHVPSFLIASVTSVCNLHCAGCYSRANHATADCAPAGQLTGEQWLDIFRQAEDLGVSFILLAGGEPLLRRDILEAAGGARSILFPIFTNGTLIDENALELFGKHRNLLPVLSIEGGRDATDARRGAGTYDRLAAAMEGLSRRGLLFGCSVTVTTENPDEVLSEGFVEGLVKAGCRALFYIELVPVTEAEKPLAPGDKERERLRAGVERLRAARPDMVLVSFPGDEESAGGCLAAGRGFFHINSHGGAEPCPFSPYSDINVAETSLREALESGLFRALRDGGHLLGEHAGGCVLYEKRELVEQLANT